MMVTRRTVLLTMSITSFYGARLLSSMIKLMNSKRHASSLFSHAISELNKENTSSNFYDSIGRPRFISAPMVDQSSLSWRVLVKRHGADLAFSQMMHARNFQKDRKYRLECIDWDDYTHLSGSKDKEQEAKLDDRPIIVQFAGNDPNILVNAGKLIHKDVNAIDLNLGCPQKIAKRGNYGAYLLSNEKVIVECLSAMVANLDCPITAKVRKLENDEDTIRLCQKIEQCGVQMLTIHGRTVSSSKLFTGPCDWDIIRKVKAALHIPVIANGGISCRSDALACLEYTGADGVMSSEALLENPKLFSESGDLLFRTDFIRFQLETVKEYRELVLSYPPPRPLFQVVRSHLFKMLYRFVDAPRHADLRAKLAMGDRDEMFAVIDELEERLGAAGLLKPEDAADSSREEWAMQQGLLGPTHWYMRHRDERAATRVLSTPRQKLYPSSSSSINSSISSSSRS